MSLSQLPGPADIGVFGPFTTGRVLLKSVEQSRARVWLCPGDPTSTATGLRDLEQVSCPARALAPSDAE